MTAKFFVYLESPWVTCSWCHFSSSTQIPLPRWTWKGQERKHLLSRTAWQLEASLSFKRHSCTMLRGSFCKCYLSFISGKCGPCSGIPDLTPALHSHYFRSSWPPWEEVLGYYFHCRWINQTKEGEATGLKPLNKAGADLEFSTRSLSTGRAEPYQASGPHLGKPFLCDTLERPSPSKVNTPGHTAS